MKIFLMQAAIAAAALTAAGLAGCHRSGANDDATVAAPADAGPETADGGHNLTDVQLLGRLIFFDANLSEPRGQSCAACHAASVGFTGPSQEINATGAVYPGAVPTRFGNRKPPSAAYAPSAPVFTQDAATKTFSGGNFSDGRATGEKLGSTAADQAQGPFLNPLEQNNPDAATVVRKVCSSSYAQLFVQVWGNSCGDVELAYGDIARSIAAYEASSEVSAFSSKYDAWKAGRASLTDQERRGLTLFEGRAKCANCHPEPLFTEFTYDNLGVPRNPMNPFYYETQVNPLGLGYADPGLGGFLKTRPEWEALAGANLGKQKVPTLRNVDQRPTPSFVKAYSHNGYFKSLKSIVHFYNTRDVLRECPADDSALVAGVVCWPAPEHAATVNHAELGNLGLTSEEEDDIVAFLGTLSDGYGNRADP